MGHLFHGTSRASPSQVLKYGFRTSNGNTGGVRMEQLESADKSRQTTANALFSRMLEAKMLEVQNAHV